MINKVRSIGGSTSVILDSLRIVAAFTVLIFHAYGQWFIQNNGANSTLGNAAHAAVIVFFVLSGYLIAYTAVRTSKLSEYLVARLSRLCSVVFPALLITAIIQVIISLTNPVFLALYERGMSWPRYLISAGFINEIWFFSSAPPLNSPLWSLSFEFWYYIIFGFWFYSKKSKKVFLTIAACLIAGPKILLLMPIWLAGNIAYTARPPKLKNKLAWLLVFLALFSAVLVMIYFPCFPNKLGTPPLFFASQFITDYISAAFIAIALWILPLDVTVKNKPAWIGWYRNTADLTFPLYLLHYPLLVLCLSIAHGYHLAQMWISTIIVLIVSFILGHMMEKKRPLWIQFFKWQVGLLSHKTPKNKLN